jgi:hypothetical protein
MEYFPAYVVHIKGELFFFQTYLKWGPSGLNLPREAIANVASISPGGYPLFYLYFRG